MLMSCLLHFHIARRPLPRAWCAKEIPMTYYRKRRRPSSRPLLNAAQIRLLRESGYTGAACLDADERSAVLAQLRRGQGKGANPR